MECIHERNGWNTNKSLVTLMSSLFFISRIFSMILCAFLLYFTRMICEHMMIVQRVDWRFFLLNIFNINNIFFWSFLCYYYSFSLQNWSYYNTNFTLINNIFCVCRVVFSVFQAKIYLCVRRIKLTTDVSSSIDRIAKKKN